MSETNWGVLGTAMIAVQRTIPAIEQSSHARLAALASRDPDKAARVVAQLSSTERAPRVHHDYLALLDDPEIDAVYIPLPNHLHLEWCVRALEAGKHVLCEKPLCLAPDDIRTLCKVRDRTGKHIEEAFAFRNHPQWDEVARRLQKGEIGPVRGAQGTIAKQFLDPADIRNNPMLGGGALYDLGCYVISACNTIFGRRPLRVVAALERDPAFGIDRLTTALLDYGDAHASFSVATQAGTDGWGTHQHLSILGADGWMRMDFPFAQARPTECRLYVGDRTSVGNLATETTVFPAVSQYALQIDRFSCLVQGEDVPSWPIEDALTTIETIEALFASAKKGGWQELGTIEPA